MQCRRSSGWISCVTAVAVCLSPWTASRVYARPDVWDLSKKQIAVLIFAESKTATFFSKTAQARFESILGDNRVTVLDKEKANELKESWLDFEDPGYVVTAEDFVANAGKYELDGVLRISLEANIFKGLVGFGSATAHIDARFIDKDARVKAVSSAPMGVPGMPPSDGLMESDAAVNAIQRAVDSVCRAAGLAILVPATPYCIDVTLKEPRRLQKPPSLPKPRKDSKLAKLADTGSNSVHAGEKVTATALAPGGGIAAVCGYKRQSHRAGGSEGTKTSADTGNRSMNIAMTAGPTFSRGRQMYYSSVVHLVDTRSRKEIGTLKAEEVGTGGRGGRNLVAAAFGDDWRYLVGVSERNVFLWDTQRGRCLSASPLPKLFKPYSIGIHATNGAQHLVVADRRGRASYAYEIERKQDQRRW